MARRTRGRAALTRWLSLLLRLEVLEADGPGGFVAVSRTIYASHYFRDGLEVKHVVPVPPDRTSFYLLSVNRSHSESLTGMKGLLLGGKIRSSARSGVERHILHVKNQAERPHP